MATIVNERDVLLQAASPRILPVVLPANWTVDYGSVAGTKPPANADSTSTVINNGLIVTGGGITLSAGGAIKGGQTSYLSGAGFYLGYSGGKYKFSIGNSASNYIGWDGTNLTIAGNLDFSYITGASKPAAYADVTQATLNTGVIIYSGGIVLSGGGSIKGGQWDFNQGAGFFIGYSGGQYKFSLGSWNGNRLTWDGSTLSLIGNISGNTNISIAGSAIFQGSQVLDAYNSAVHANSAGGAGYGVYGRTFWINDGAGIVGRAHNGGTGVYGTSTPGTGGMGGSGGEFGGTGPGFRGVLCWSTSGPAIDINVGRMYINNSTRVDNLNAHYLDGIGVHNLLDGMATDSGTAWVNSGLDLHSGLTGYQFTGSGKTITLAAISDRSLKDGIEDETLGLDFVNSLRPVTFRMKGKSVIQHGFIAQEVEPNVPVPAQPPAQAAQPAQPGRPAQPAQPANGSVSTDQSSAVPESYSDALSIRHEDGTQATDYLSMIGPMVLAIQQLSQQVTKLRSP